MSGFIYNPIITDWTVYDDSSVHVRKDDGKDCNVKPDKFLYGEIYFSYKDNASYQLITQKSTSYKKWVCVEHIERNGIEIAFYDADWKFVPDDG
jgi:hypothetical protein